MTLATWLRNHAGKASILIALSALTVLLVRGVISMEVFVAITATWGVALLVMVFRPESIEEISLHNAKIKRSVAAAEKVVETAEVTLEKVQELAALTAKIQLSLLVRHGRLLPYTDDELTAYHDQSIRILEQMGVSREKRQEVLNDRERFDKIDYVLAIMGGCYSLQLAPGLDATVRGELERSTRSLRSQHPLPTPDELASFWSDERVVGPREEIKEWIEDYRHFLATGQHRRPEQFSTRHDIHWRSDEPRPSK